MYSKHQKRGFLDPLDRILSDLYLEDGFSLSKAQLVPLMYSKMAMDTHVALPALTEMSDVMQDAVIRGFRSQLMNREILHSVYIMAKGEYSRGKKYLPNVALAWWLWMSYFAGFTSAMLMLDKQGK